MPVMNPYNNMVSMGNPYSSMNAMSQSQQPNYYAQPVPQPQLNAVPGRVVGSIEEVLPSEVPMNGQLAFFPIADGSMVYSRRWLSNGTIETIKYDRETIQEASAPANTLSNDFQMDILNRLERIEKSLSYRGSRGSKKAPQDVRTEENNG